MTSEPKWLRYKRHHHIILCLVVLVLYYLDFFFLRRGKINFFLKRPSFSFSVVMCLWTHEEVVVPSLFFMQRISYSRILPNNNDNDNNDNTEIHNNNLKMK